MIRFPAWLDALLSLNWAAIAVHGFAAYAWVALVAPALGFGMVAAVALNALFWPAMEAWQQHRSGERMFPWSWQKRLEAALPACLGLVEAIR